MINTIVFFFEQFVFVIQWHFLKPHNLFILNLYLEFIFPFVFFV